MKKYKVLLIGGEGYVGCVIKNFFIANNFYVESLDGLLYKNCDSVVSNYSLNYKFIHGYLSEFNENFNPNKFDLIILLAGLVGDPVVRKYKKLSQFINYEQIQNVILNLIKKYKNSFFFISTCSNYGLMNYQDRADENYKLNPISEYSKAKVAAEKLILNSVNKTKMSPTIFRFATAFGASPRMRFDLTLNEFILNIYNDNPIEVYDPDTWRPYCHVIDFANILYQSFMSKISLRKFQVYNAGFNKNHTTKRQLVYLITNLLGKNLDNVKFINSSGNDARNYKVNFNKISKLVGNRPMFDIKKGILQLKHLMDNKIYEDFGKELKKGNYIIDHKKSKLLTTLHQQQSQRQ